MEDEKYLEVLRVDEAYKNWQQAINLFNNAITNEDIDFAVYNLEAKRRQYLRVLSEVKSDDSIQKDDFL